MRIEGKGVQPASMPIAELGYLLSTYSETLLPIVSAMHPDFSAEDSVLLSLAGLEEGSLILHFDSAVPALALEANQLVTRALQKGYFADLPSKSVQAIERLVEYARKKDFQLHLHTKGQPASTIDAHTVVNQGGNATQQGQTTVYGELIRIGGATEPKAAVRMDDGKSLAISVSEEQAKELAPQLYKRIGLSGIARWQSQDWAIKEFKLERILPYQETPFNEAMQALREAAAPAWDAIDSEKTLREIGDSEG